MKLPNFESLEEKRDDLASAYAFAIGPVGFINGFNEALTLRDEMWASKVGKLIEAMKQIEGYFCACSDDGEIIPQVVAESALAEFYGENGK